MSTHDLFVILGAGVVGLTTALSLSDRYPTSHIKILASHLPGDRDIAYASPWAGANWLSGATDNGRQEAWDRVTYKKFEELADHVRGAGVKRLPIWAFYDSKLKDAGVVSEDTGKIWYEELAGVKMFDKEHVKVHAEGALFGYECQSFVINVQVYLPWLQGEALERGIEFQRKTISDINEVFREFPTARATFNCTGIGSFNLKGVEDKTIYPTRGQVMLVENPAVAMKRMYFRSPQRVNKDTTYVFPRNPGGGVILGGCRFDNEWDGEVDLEFAEDIKRRCCALAPELGKPEDLKVIHHGVGLRPSRKGGARIEQELIGDRLVVHNYGAGGAGYQASWGMAANAVELLLL